MNFDNLNEDCVFLILENLNCADLLSMAQINNKFSTLAANVYRRKFSHSFVEVSEDVESPFELSELLNGV